MRSAAPKQIQSSHMQKMYDGWEGLIRHWGSSKQKKLALICYTDSVFRIINNLITKSFGSKKVMTEEKGHRNQQKQGDNNLSQAPSMIQDDGDGRMRFTGLAGAPSFMHGILHAPSIFSGSACRPTLDQYLKIKSKDKPKDTLKQIQQKKQAFISYCSPPKLQSHPLKTQIKKQNTKIPSSRIKQQFSEFTFYKNCKQRILLFIRISHARPNKCNISVSNILGEILKYYPNVFLSKKEGKIMKFISENKECLMVVFDYTRIDATIKAFPSLLNQARMLYYEIIDLHVENETLKLTANKVSQNMKGTLESVNNKVILMSNGLCSLKEEESLQGIFQRLRNIELEQQQFLDQFRGVKANSERNLTFDMMSINLWRQFKWFGVVLSNKIIQLFESKEGEMDELIVKDPQVLHTPKRLLTSQNCSLCLSKNEEIKRPRRTSWICTSCSAEKQKPIYLCKGCFKNYHTNNDVYLYRKNEKKTKKFKKIIRQRKNLSKKDQPAIKQEERKVEHTMIAESDRLLMDLDRKCDQFFGKLDELMEEKCFASAEFYIQMLMNMSIIKTQQYLKKVGKRQPSMIKFEQK